MIALWIIAGFIAAVLLAWLVSPACVRMLDRAPHNDRKLLASSYELPRYGGIDTTGWDAWTVCALPEDPALPPHMVRGTLMTGLYGLDGADNYERLTYRLDDREAIEHLCLVPTSYALPDGGTLVLDHLTQNYLPRSTGLRMADAELDVRVQGTPDVAYGHITGAWPNYHIHLLNPEAEIRVRLDYTGRRILWWTDIPGFYTHFAAFGDFEATVVYNRGTRIHDVHLPLPNPETLKFRARGAVEHVSATNKLWLPIRLRRWLHYHYEVLFGEGLEGGFVYARAFGLEYRNRGGLYAGDAWHEIKQVRLRYAEHDPVDNCGGLGGFTKVPRQWHVDATTDAGPLQYTALRTHPPAMTGSNTSQYHFEWQGAWRGQSVAGRGYGEYARL
jgi:hypothetical protein